MNRQILSNLSAKYEENYRNSYNLADEESYAARFYAAFTEAINSVMHQSEDSLEIGSDQAKIDVAILLAAQFDSKAYQARTVQQHNHFHEQFISFFNAVIDPILGLGLNITEPNKILTTNAALQNYITSFGFSENFSLSTKDAMISNLQQNIHTHRRVHDLAIYNRFIYNLNTPPSAIETIGLHLMTRRNVITPIQAVELEFNLDNLAERAFNIELSTFLLTLKAALTNRPLEQVLFNIPSEFFNDEKYAEQRAIFLEEFLPLVAELGPNIRFVFAGAQPSLLKEIEEKLAPLLESKKIDSALSFSNSIQSASGAYTTTTEQICLTANPKINNNFTDVTEAVSFLDENLIKTMIDDTVIQSLNKSLSSGMNHIVARNVLSQSPKTPLTMYQWVTDLIGSPALMQICEKWTPARWNPMWSSFSVLNKRTESTTQTKLNGRFANPGQMPNEESQTAVLHIADIETDLIKKPYPICIEMTQDQWVQGHKVVIDELKKKHQDPNNKIVLTKTGSMSKEIRITDSDGNDIAFPEQNNNIKKTIAHPLYVPEVKKIVLPESSLANKLGKCSPLNEDADNRISRANADKTEIIQHIDTNIEKLRTLVDARNAVFNQNHISTICTSLETRIVENHAHRQALKTIKEQSSSILKPSSTSLLSRALSDLESAYTAHYDDKAYDLAIKNAVENCTKYEKQLVSLRDDIQKNKLLENEPDFQSVITTLSDNITSFQEVNRSLSAFSSTDSEKIVNKSLFFKKEISATQTMIESCYELLNDTQPIDIARNTILKMVKNIDDRMEIETNRLLDITVLLEQYPRQTAKNISTENKNLTTFEQNWKTFRENPINDSTGVMAYINSTFTTLRNSLVDLTRSLKIATGGAVFFHQNSEYSQFSNAIKDVKTLLNSNKILNTPDIQLAIESLEKLDVASREYCDINPAIEPKTLTQLCDAHQDAIAKYTDYTPIVVKEAEGVPTLNVPEYQEYLVKNGDLDITIFQDFSIEAFQKLSQASIEKVCDKNSSDFKQDNPEFKNLLTREITYRNIVNNAMAFEIQIPKDKNDFLPHLTSCLASSQKLLSNLDIVRNSNTTTKESLDAILAAKSECLAYCEALNAFTAAIPGLPKSFEQHIADMKSFATELDSLEDGYDTSDLFLSLVQANTSLSISNIFDKITAFEEILKSPITLTDGVSITAKSAGENTGYAITVLEYAKVYTTLLEEFKKNSAKKINDSLHVLLNHGNEIIRSIRIQEAQTWDGFSKMLRGLSGYPTQSPLSVIQKIIGIITNESPFRFDFGLIDWERKASPDQNTITAIGTQIFSQVLNNVRSHPVMEASARKLSIRGVTKNYGAPLPYNHTVEYIDLSAFNNIEGLTSAATESLTDLAMQQCEMLTNDALTEFFYRMKQLGVHTIIVQKNLHDPLLALLKKSGIHLNILKEAVPVVPVKSICTDMSVLVLDANALSHELDIPSFENAYCISKINLQNEYTFSINSTLAEITKIYTSKKNEIDAQYLTYSQEYQTTITQTIETIIEEITAYYATTVQLSAVQNSALLCAMIQEKIETLVLKQSDKLPSAFGKHFAKALEQIIFPKIEATRVTSQYSLANWMNDITHATKESVSAYETHYRNASINFANAQMAIMNSENNLFNAEAIPELEISQEANEEEEDEEESEAINETNHNQDEDADQDENLNTQLDSLRGPTIWKLKAPTAFINDRAIKPLRLFSWSTWLKESLAFLINMQSIASPSCWNNKYAIFDATSFAQNLGISHTLLTYLSTTSRCLFNGTDKDLLLYQSNSLSAETYGRHSANNSIFNESNLIDLALIQQNTIYLPIAGDEILATMQGMPTNFSIDESLLATKADYLKTVQAGQITKDFHTTKSNENALQKIWDNALIDHVPYLFLSNLFSATAQNNPTNVVEKQIADLINTNNSLKHRSKLMYDLTLMIGAHADKNSNLNLVHRLELSWETLSKNNELLLKEFFSIPNNNTLPGSRIPEKYFTEFLHYYNQYLLNQVTTSGILPCPTPENLSIAITAFLSSTEKFLLQEAQKNYSQKIQNGAQIDLKGITQLLGNANKKAVSMFIKKYVFNMAGKSLSLIESGSLTQKLHAFYTTNKSLETKRHIIASQHVSATDLKLQRLVNDCRKIRPSLNESSFLIYLEHLDGKNFLAQDSIPSEMLLYPYENMFLDEFQEKQATLNSTNPGSTVKVENLDCAKTIREFWERYQVLATQSSIGKKSPICDLAENFQKLLNYYCDSKYCDLATFENYFNRLLTPIRYPFLMDACVRLGFVMNDFKSHNKDSIKNTLKNNLDNLSKLFGIFNEEERTEKQHVGQLSIIFELIEKCQKRIFDATDKKHTEEYLSLAHDITNTLKIIDDFTKQEINDFEDNTPTSFWENLLISIFGKNHPFQNSKKYNMIQKNYSQKFTSLIIALLAQCEKVGSTNSSTINIKDINSLVSSIAKLANSTTDKSHAALKNLLDNVRYLQSFSKDDLNTVRNTAILATQENLAMDDLLSNLIATQNNKKTAAQDASEKAARRVIENDRVIDPEDTKKRPRYEQLVDDIEFVNLPKELNESEDDIRALFKKSIKEIHDLINPTSGAILLSGPQWPNSLKEFNSRSIHSLSHDEKRSFIDKARHYLMTQQHHQGKNIGELMPLYLTLIAVIGTMMAQSSAKGLQFYPNAAQLIVILMQVISPRSYLQVGTGEGKTAISIITKLMHYSMGYRPNYLSTTPILTNQSYYEFSPLLSELNLSTSLYNGTAPTEDMERADTLTQSLDAILDNLSKDRDMDAWADNHSLIVDEADVPLFRLNISFKIAINHLEIKKSKDFSHKDLAIFYEIVNRFAATELSKENNLFSPQNMPHPSTSSAESCEEHHKKIARKLKNFSTHLIEKLRKKHEANTEDASVNNDPAIESHLSTLPELTRFQNKIEKFSDAVYFELVDAIQQVQMFVGHTHSNSSGSSDHPLLPGENKHYTLSEINVGGQKYIRAIPLVRGVPYEKLTFSYQAQQLLHAYLNNYIKENQALFAKRALTPSAFIDFPKMVQVMDTFATHFQKPLKEGRSTMITGTIGDDDEINQLLEFVNDDICIAKVPRYQQRHVAHKSYMDAYSAQNMELTSDASFLTQLIDQTVLTKPDHRLISPVLIATGDDATTTARYFEVLCDKFKDRTIQIYTANGLKVRHKDGHIEELSYYNGVEEIFKEKSVEFGTISLTTAGIGSRGMDYKPNSLLQNQSSTFARFNKYQYSNPEKVCVYFDGYRFQKITPATETSEKTNEIFYGEDATAAFKKYSATLTTLSSPFTEREENGLFITQSGVKISAEGVQSLSQELFNNIKTLAHTMLITNDDSSEEIDPAYQLKVILAPSEKNDPNSFTKEKAAAEQAMGRTGRMTEAEGGAYGTVYIPHAIIDGVIQYTGKTTRRYFEDPIIETMHNALAKFRVLNNSLFVKAYNILAKRLNLITIPQISFEVTKKAIARLYNTARQKTRFDKNTPSLIVLKVIDLFKSSIIGRGFGINTVPQQKLYIEPATSVGIQSALKAKNIFTHIKPSQKAATESASDTGYSCVILTSNTMSESQVYEAYSKMMNDSLIKFEDFSAQIKVLAADAWSDSALERINHEGKINSGTQFILLPKPNDYVGMINAFSEFFLSAEMQKRDYIFKPVCLSSITPDTQLLAFEQKSKEARSAYQIGKWIWVNTVEYMLYSWQNLKITALKLESHHCDDANCLTTLATTLKHAIESNFKDKLSVSNSTVPVRDGRICANKITLENATAVQLTLKSDLRPVYTVDFNDRFAIPKVLSSITEWLPGFKTLTSADIQTTGSQINPATTGMHRNLAREIFTLPNLLKNVLLRIFKTTSDFTELFKESVWSGLNFSAEESTTKKILSEDKLTQNSYGTALAHEKIAQYYSLQEDNPQYNAYYIALNARITSGITLLDEIKNAYTCAINTVSKEITSKEFFSNKQEIGLTEWTLFHALEKISTDHVAHFDGILNAKKSLIIDKLLEAHVKQYNAHCDATSTVTRQEYLQNLYTRVLCQHMLDQKRMKEFSSVFHTHAEPTALNNNAESIELILTKQIKALQTTVESKITERCAVLNTLQKHQQCFIKANAWAREFKQAIYGSLDQFYVWVKQEHQRDDSQLLSSEKFAELPASYQSMYTKRILQLDGKNRHHADIRAFMERTTPPSEIDLKRELADSYSTLAQSDLADALTSLSMNEFYHALKKSYFKNDYLFVSFSRIATYYWSNISRKMKPYYNNVSMLGHAKDFNLMSYTFADELYADYVDMICAYLFDALAAIGLMKFSLFAVTLIPSVYGLMFSMLISFAASYIGSLFMGMSVKELFVRTTFLSSYNLFNTYLYYRNCLGAALRKDITLILSIGTQIKNISSLAMIGYTTFNTKMLRILNIDTFYINFYQSIMQIAYATTPLNNKNMGALTDIFCYQFVRDSILFGLSTTWNIADFIFCKSLWYTSAIIPCLFNIGLYVSYHILAKFNRESVLDWYFDAPKTAVQDDYVFNTEFSQKGMNSINGLLSDSYKREETSVEDGISTSLMRQTGLFFNKACSAAVEYTAKKSI